MNSRCLSAFLLSTSSLRVWNHYIVRSLHHKLCIVPQTPLFIQAFIEHKPHYNSGITKRHYASKDKAKSSSKKKVAKFNENELAQVIDVQNLRSSMEQAVEVMKDAFVKQLSLRSAGGSVETLKIDFEGDSYELQEVAQITRKGQQTVVINMIAFPQLTKTVMDTLKTSNLNLNPQQDGTTIFVPTPKVTKEHREILAKRAKALFITSRDAVRKVQEKYIREIKDGDFSEDVKGSATEQIKAMGDSYVTQAENIMKTKKDELLGS